MSFTVSCRDFRNSVARVARFADQAVGASGEVGLLIASDPEKAEISLHLSGPGLALLVSDSVPGSVIAAARAWVPPRLLLQMLKMIDDEDRLSVDIAERRSDVRMSAGNITFDLPILHPTGSDDVRAPGEVLGRFSASSDALAAALKVVSPAISSDDMRYYLQGILIHTATDTQVNLVSSDGSRMHCVTLDVSGVVGEWSVQGKVDPILAGETAIALLSSLPQRQVTPVTIELERLASGSLVVAVRFDRFILRSPAIAGKYPDYSRLLREAAAATAGWCVKISALSDVLKRMARTLGDNRYLSLELDDTFVVRAAAMERGAISVTVDATTPGGRRAVCVVNVDYLTAALNVLPGKTAHLRTVGDGQGPLLLGTPENANVTLAVMPVRL